MGYNYYIGAELEYFYFGSDKSPELLDHGGILTYSPATNPPSPGRKP